ncbi:hypothetical protein [Paenibacillus ferrarius]
MPRLPLLRLSRSAVHGAASENRVAWSRLLTEEQSTVYAAAMILAGSDG